MKKSFFLTFEGTDGVGKTTQIQLLRKWLRSRRIPVQLTREPGGGLLAEKIRKILLDPRVKMSDLTELFLYEAARAEHMAQIILPARQKKKLVLCDRFTDATLAYQGSARKLPFSLISKLNKIATGGIKPDLTILLDLPPRLGLKKARARRQNKKGDRLENEGLSFQYRVRRGYLALAKKEPRRIKVVRVQDTKEDTHRIICQLVARKLRQKGYKV